MHHFRQNNFDVYAFLKSASQISVEHLNATFSLKVRISKGMRVCVSVSVLCVLALDVLNGDKEFVKSNLQYLP